MSDNNLEIKETSVIKTTTQNLTKTSLLNKIKGKEQAILVDLSGSMGYIINSEGQSRYNIVKHVLSSVLKVGSNYNLFGFHSDFFEFNLNNMPLPSACTNMGKAFTMVKNKGTKQIILLTDGEPDSEIDALDAAKGLDINIIYIGPKPVPDFLLRLGKLSNNSIIDNDLLDTTKINLLENQIKGLLK